MTNLYYSYQFSCKEFFMKEKIFFNIDLESFQKVLPTEVNCGCMLQGQFCNGRTHDKTLVLKSRFVFGHGSIQEISIFPAVEIAYG